MRFPGEKGSTTVQVAFVLPIFLVLIFGGEEFCRYFFTKSSIQRSLEEAGRFAMLNISATDAQITAKAQANLVGVNSASVTYNSSSQTSGGINYKLITATHTYTFILGGYFFAGNGAISCQVKVPLVP